MNVDKALLKMQLAQSYARDLEAIEDQVRKDLHRMEGTAETLRQVATAMEGHRPYYQTATDEGELDLAQCKLAMQVIDRCVGGLQNLMDKATIARQLKQGELAGVGRSIATLKKSFDQEKAKVEAVAQMVEYDGRPSTPANEDLQRRREQAKAAKATRKKATRKKVTKKKAK